MPSKRNIENIKAGLAAKIEERDQNIYGNYNQEILDQSLPTGEYTTVDVLREAYGRYLTNEKITQKLNNVNIIETKESLHAYIKKELGHQNKIKDIRFYRGHYEAKWNCQSTLLRAFQDFYMYRQKESSCSIQMINHLHDFRLHHHQLWENLLKSNNIKEIFHETFRAMENIINVREMADKYHCAAKNYANYLKGQVSPNAAKRELAAQHYGLPTTLVDFTTCLCVALYFAAHGKDNLEDKKHIDNYLSIIHFDTDDKVVNIEEMRGRSLSLRESEIQSTLHISQFRKDREKWDRIDDSMELNEKIGMYYIAPSKYRSVDNERLIKQQGVLLCMSKNYHCSVEQVCKYGSHSFVPNLNCTLINKSLIPEIKDFLGDRVTEKKLGLV